MPDKGMPATAEGMRISDLLCPKRVVLRSNAATREDLLEELSALLGGGEPALDPRAILRSLLEREHLGSTGVGHGIALPHGRLKGLPQPIGAFATLASEMDYHALDHKPVTMAFALLMPDDAVEAHLRILSRLAGIFQNHDTRQELLAAQTTEEICRRFVRAEARTTG
jgi:PTS system nitrogen regulatory IIA component